MDNNFDDRQSQWNFDGAQYEFIFMIKRDTSLALHNWDLESAYNNLRTFRREVDALADEITYKEKKNKLAHDDSYVRNKMNKLFEESQNQEEKVEEEKTSERKELAKIMEDVEKMRAVYEENKDDENIRSEYYFILEEAYLFMSRILKDHKAVFREETKYMGL